MSRWKDAADGPYYWRSSEQRNVYDQFLEAFGFDQYAASFNIKNMKKFLNGDRSYNAGFYHTEIAPYQDHAAAFKKKGTARVVWVFHPYYLCDEYLREIGAWCNDRDLIGVVCSTEHSFYYPGGTMMVMVMSQGTYRDFTEASGLLSEWGTRICTGSSTP